MTYNPNDLKMMDLFSVSGVEVETQYSDLTILSCGCGQDSVTMLAQYVYDASWREKYAPGRFLVLFADTHSELPETYDYLERVIKPFCVEHKIEFVHITNDMGYHGDTWQSLECQWLNGERATIGSVAYNPTCSHNLKLQPQYRYVEEWLPKHYDVPAKKRKQTYVEFAKRYGKIRWIVGIAAGEEPRVFDVSKETALWKKQAVEVVYPLIEEKMGRQECQDYLKSIGMEIPFPSSCLMCHWQTEVELLWTSRAYPDKFERWCELEERKLNDPLNKAAVKNVGVRGRLHKDGPKRGQPVTLKDALREAEEKYGHMTLNELTAYRFNHGSCAKSAY